MKCFIVSILLVVSSFTVQQAFGCPTGVQGSCNRETVMYVVPQPYPVTR